MVPDSFFQPFIADDFFFIYIVEVVEVIVEVTKVPKNDINNILEKGF